ncbi:PDZ domain-containing protein [Nautilia lithotrophica]
MKNFKYINIFIISFLSMGIIWEIVSFYLPKYPEIYNLEKNNNNFYNINISKIFISNKKVTNTNQTNIKQISNTLNNLELKAVYNDGKKAFIIVKDKKNTIFLDLYQTYKEYKLIKISSTYAIFQKNNKKYILSFNNKQKNRVKKYSNSSTKKISKKVINEYKHNFSKIWNEIGIIRNKKGYKITYVKKGGIFDKLGLKTGDIIVKVNGEEITNDIQAWNLYNNIDKYNYLEIEIRRNNQTKVINYEIN